MRIDTANSVNFVIVRRRQAARAGHQFRLWLLLRLNNPPPAGAHVRGVERPCAARDEQRRRQHYPS